MKRFFNTPKKAVISVICIVIVVFIIIGVTSIRDTESDRNENDFSQSKEISIDAAKTAALADADLSETDVTFTKTSLDDDEHIRVYDIEFYTSDMEYDYEINAYDGTVYEKNMEALRTRSEDSTDNNADNSSNNYIGIDRAKEIALNRANLSKTEVQFTKAKLENDDGKVEYEIEFYFDKAEYSYEIDAVSGDILESDVDFD